MSDYDPDKLRFHSTEEGFNPGYVLGSFRKAISNLRDAMEIIVNSRAMRVSKERVNLSRDYLTAFETTMLAYRDAKPIGKLNTEQQRKILCMVEDVLNGKRECVQFQLNRGCDGIKEIFSNQVFNIKEQDNDRF